MVGLRRLAAGCWTLLLLLSLLPSVSFGSGLQSFIGTWEDQNNIFPKVVITSEESSSKVCVYIYTSCTINPNGLCGLDGQEATCARPQIYLSNPHDVKFNVSTMIIERIYSFKKYRLQLTVEGNSLRIQDFSLFTDGSNRSPYSWLFILKKIPTQS